MEEKDGNENRGEKETAVTTEDGARVSQKEKEKKKMHQNLRTQR